MLWIPFVIAMGLVLTVFQAYLREEHPQWAVLVALAFTVTIFLSLISHFSAAIQALTELAGEAQIHSIYLGPVLKTIGIAYLTSFGVQISQEAGEESISAIMELAGKLVILLIALPLLQAILKALFGMLNS